MKKQTSTARISEQIDSAIQPHQMLNHPFYRLWSEGKLTIDSIKEYAKQYFLFIYQFPTFISALHSQAPNLPVRQLLLQNLTDEEMGEKNHPELWLKFCDALGLSRQEVKSAQPLWETKELIDSFGNLTRNKSFAQGMAALYAYESQIPKVSAEKIDSLGKYYGITDPGAIEFFSVHKEADIEHSRINRDILNATVRSSQTKKTIQGGEELARALWKFLNGINRAYVSSANPVGNLN
jgi:pyrroloquinoline-quinone synthase